MPDLPDLANLDYVDRINRAIDHITAHLDGDLSLDEVARVACFSPWHFHRVFRSATGETLAAFIKRVRLERAVYLMSHRAGATLTEIALACGFASSSDFSRSFRAHFGVAPRRFDIDAFRTTRRQQMHAALTPDGAEQRLTRLPVGANPDGFAVVVRRLPARHVAYVRAGYSGEGMLSAVERLQVWARARGLEHGQWLGAQWDDPEIVPLDKCRYDVGLEVPASTAGGGEVGTMTFAPTSVAELPIAGTIELELRAIDWLYTTWLPHSGWAPAHQPFFEAWEGAPFAHGVEHFELRLQLAVVRLDAPL